MTVAVMHGMARMEDKLREAGFNVVTYGEYNYPIDAVLYHGESLDGFSFTSQNVSAVGAGVLMINVTNKSFDEINKMLKTRLYSPLF